MHFATLMGFADELHKVAYVLTEKKRQALPKKTFALPQSKEYPIPDRQHAKSALGFAKMHHAGTAEEAKVRAKVRAKYPDLVKDAQIQQDKNGMTWKKRFLKGLAGYVAPQVLNHVAVAPAVASISGPTSRPLGNHLALTKDVYDRMGIKGRVMVSSPQGQPWSRAMSSQMDLPFMAVGNDAAELAAIIPETNSKILGGRGKADYLVNVPRNIHESAIAHEFGHIKNDQLWGAVGRRAGAISRRLSPVGASITGLASSVTDEPSYVPGVAQLAVSSPTLADEAGASLRAAKHLVGKYGLGKGLMKSLPLVPAFGTYAALAGTPLGITAVRKYLKKRTQTQTNSSLATE